MVDSEEHKFDLIDKYREQFGKGPPLWKLSDEEAIRRMTIALESGEPMKGLNPVLPDDTVM